MRILVIEDNLDFAAFVSAVLELEGHQVRRVMRLGAGLDLIQNERFELVLLDLSLPDGSGLDFFERPESHAVRVIVMTSLTDDAVRARLQAVPTTYFIKPISARDLVGLVQQVQLEN